MPKVTDSPVGIQALEFHGVDFVAQTSKNSIAECCFCGKPKKLYCNQETGQWDCKSCQLSGNTFSFFTKLWEFSKEQTTEKDYKTFSLDRKIKDETLKIWGVCKSILTGEWLVPGFSIEGKLTQLYRYVNVYDMRKDVHRKVLMMTPGLGSNGALTHALHGMNLYSPECRIIYHVEGPWDAMALWESLRSYTVGKGGRLKVTANSQESLLVNCSVLASPGAGVFLDTWPRLFSNKLVRLGYDSDHKREVKVKSPISKPTESNSNSNNNNGHSTSLVDGAGLAGIKHAVKVLVKAEEEVTGIEYLKWGSEGFDPTKPSGWDIRDELTSNPKVKGEILAGLLLKFTTIPEEWTRVTGSKQAAKILPIECKDYKKIINAMRTCAKVTPGLQRGLAVCLACVISTEQPEDQLWVKLVGPPSSFKTSIVDAIAIAKKHVVMTAINGFYSGYKSDADGKEDHSLVNKCRNKTLITKDGDTLLQSSNISQILSEARDIYDKSGGKTYRSDVKRNYENINMTWILCGTSSLRYIDSSELGERFLTTVIMDKIDPLLEFEIGMRKVNHIRGVMGRGKGQTTSNTERYNKFKALTGGYVEYIRSNADELLDNVYMSDEVAQLCCRLGTFVAYMRARPSTKQDEDVERELCPRLVSQLSKLAFCLAAVMQKDSVDDVVMDYVCKVASDTARGKTAKIVKQLHKHGRKGMNLKAIALVNGEKESKMQDYLHFLCKIDLIEMFDASSHFGHGAGMRYRLTESVEELYIDIIKASRKFDVASRITT